MPRPRLARGRRIWDIDEIDVAFKSLPLRSSDIKSAEQSRLARAAIGQLPRRTENKVCQ
jgi:hypothetical protein